MSINLSPRQFRASGLETTVLDALRENLLQPERLELELTESVVADDPELAKGVLERLKAIGVSIAIDDFGTGFSSLSYLRSYPLDRLKIDRGFVQEIGSTSDGAAISSAIISLARMLGLQSIAEGVESSEQLDYLGREGCELAQGYHISRPLEAAALVDWLKARP